ncbi:MFS transporter [Cellulomonas sp. H30R-01]|uniref:MFS transporter n=1 Tax=Cellulomonas sp. H30R-01 TaxID=2704467 RepID=UPI00138B45D2|nr:MFS transporter [Cellulomonas sp. H30R-01]QHT56861.1 MFS transporter [Cellulomonas sp. H30R-01]
MTRVPAPAPARSDAPSSSPSRRAYAVYAAAVVAYFVAIVHRTAMGVAGVEAVDRFALSATALSSFVVAQLLLYTLMQIPAGRLLDRFGPRAVITAGSLVMAAGQLLLAVADTVPVALLARVLLGAGDAGIFISAVRLIAEWFPPRKAPVMVQVTGLVGQSGNLASAIPVAWLLHHHGWTTTFGTLAAVGVVAAGVAFGGIRSAQPRDPLSHERLAPALRAALQPPGTRLGFWSHFATPFSANVVALLWGVPFFVTAQGRTAAEASLLLTALTLTAMVTGPVVGRFTARHPLRRSWSVLASCAVTLVAWVWLLVPSTPRPLWQLVVFVVLVGAGGPVSLVGMDFARTFSPPTSLGTASGFVNTGGFTSTIAGLLGVGVVLQLVEPHAAGTYSLDAYRIAFTVLLVPWVVGVVGVLSSRRRTRALMAEAGVVVPPLREALRRVRGR